MKSLILISVFILIGFSSNAFCQSKIFIRDYTYKASEADSKLSSRKKALEQVKIILLGEIGSYIESTVELKTEEKNDKIEEFFKNEINTITAGITETKIIEERWDGYIYYIKAEIALDTEDVLKRINQSIEKQINSKEIIKLRKLLTEEVNSNSNNIAEIETLNKELASEKSKRITKEKELNSLNIKLKDAKLVLLKIEQEKRNTKTEVEKINSKIKNLTKNTVENVKIGMIPDEVIKVNGNPRAKDECMERFFWNYGKVWVLFNAGVVASVFESNKYDGACKSAQHYISLSIISY